MLSVCAEAIVPSSKGWMEWDVTDHVKDAIRDGLSEVNFLIKDKEENSHSDQGLTTSYFNSKSATNASLRPFLVSGGVSILASKDTVLNQYIPNENYGSMTNDLPISARAGGFNCRIIMSFPIDGINLIDKATLNLYLSYLWNGKNRTIQVYKLSRPNWEEMQSTWNIYKTGENWTTAGGDYVAEVMDLPEQSGARQIVFPAKFPRKYP